MTTKTVKLSLLQNAESFATEGIRCAILAEEQEVQWKFAILHIVQAIELTLKEILRREHWSLIYEKVDEQKLTVSLDKALSRIQKVSEVSFHKADIKKIDAAVKVRNTIVHHEVEYTTPEMKIKFANMLGFLQHCHQQYLNRHLSDVIPKDLWQKAILIEAYANELYEKAKKKIQSAKLDTETLDICPRCSKDTFCLNKEFCYTCGHKDHIEPCCKCGCPVFTESESYAKNQYDQPICGTCVILGIQ